MRHLAFALAVLLVACSAPAASAVPSAPAATPAVALDGNLCADGTPTVPQRFRANTPWLDADGCRVTPQKGPPPVPSVQPPAVPIPDVALVKSAFGVSTLPAPRRVAGHEPGPSAVMDFARNLIGRLDNFRSPTRIGSVSDGEWDSVVWPGPFQRIVRAAVAAKPAAGRFFHVDEATLDADYVLPAHGIQFSELTLRFRDHAEDPPADGELFYVWHLRVPNSGGSGFWAAVADGYDGVTAKTWTRTNATYWTASLLETEAKSATAGYLWNESYVPGGNQQFASNRDTTPFWHQRIEGLNHLNALFAAGTLTERRFENMSVRIDAFEPVTYFGGGVMTVTVRGRLVEVIGGKTVTESLTQPLKFFRFGGNGLGLSGWTAVDAQEDGVWLSGGDLALDKLQSSFG